MEKKIRMGIVGSGNAAFFHYASYLRVTGIPVKVVGVTSLDKAQCGFLPRAEGFRPLPLSEMLPEVDLIDNCTPGYAHEPVSVASFETGKHVIVEKPFTGYYGPSGDEVFEGNRFPKEKMLEQSLASAGRIIAAALKSKKKLCYAENWVYAPAVQKETEIPAKSNHQILWALGDQFHSGSPSTAYGIWKLSGGGSIVGKSCHPLTAILYLKQIEGMPHRCGQGSGGFYPKRDRSGPGARPIAFSMEIATESSAASSFVERMICSPTGNGEPNIWIGMDTPHCPNRLPGRVLRMENVFHALAFSTVSQSETGTGRLGVVGETHPSKPAIRWRAMRQSSQWRRYRRK